MFVVGVLMLVFGVALVVLGLLSGVYVVKYSVGLIDAEVDVDALFKVMLTGLAAGVLLVRYSVDFF
jgi:hypothetical protein